MPKVLAIADDLTGALDVGVQFGKDSIATYVAVEIDCDLAQLFQQFEVVAVNIDTRDPDKPRAWLKEVGVGRLGYYADPSAKVFQDLKTVGRAAGMPTTLLVDPAGCEIGTVAGPAEWASEDAVKLVTAALER